MKFEKIILVIISVLVAGMEFISCSRGYRPEIVNNPLEEEVYYIIGQIKEENSPVEGVVVSSSGTQVETSHEGWYQLPVNQKGKCTVSYMKEGYIPITTTVLIPEEMQTRSSVALPLQMAKKNPVVTIDPSRDTVIVYPGADKLTSIIFPAGISDQPIDVSATEFINGPMVDLEHAGLVTFDLEVSGPEKTLPVEIINQANPLLHVGQLVHCVEVDGQWKEMAGTIGTFNWLRNIHEATIQSSYAIHSIGPKLEVDTILTSFESAGEVVIDNLGSLFAKEVEIMSKQKMGWEITSDMDSYYSIFPGLTDSDCKYTTQSLYKVLASVNGSLAGVSETDVPLGIAKVSGDTKMTIKFFTRVDDVSLQYILMFQGIWDTKQIKYKRYSGMNIEIDYQYGSSHIGNQK